MSWNRPASGQKPVVKKAPPKISRGFVAGLVVVLAAVGAIVYLTRSNDEGHAVRKERKPERIKEVKPAAAPKPVVTQAVEKVAKADRWAELGKLVSCTTNASFGRVTSVYIDAEGRKHKVFSSSRSPLFKHNTDNLLAMALCNVKANVPLPPLPMIPGSMDQAFRDSLKDPIEISPDDSPEDVERKQTVIEARARMKELMDQGGSFAEILADHQRHFNEDRNIRNEAARELQRIVDDGDTEGTRQFLLKMNVALQQMGIQELEEPKKSSERKAEILERLAEREAAKEQSK